MSSYQYRKSHCGDKTVVRSSYLHNGISYTGKMSSLYQSGPWCRFNTHRHKPITWSLEISPLWNQNPKNPVCWFNIKMPFHQYINQHCANKTSLRPFIFTMMTSSNGNIFRVTGPLCGEFTGPGEFPTQRPVTRSFDIYFDLRLNKRLSKQPWGWWFETPS